MRTLSRLDIGSPCLLAAFHEEDACFLSERGDLHVTAPQGRSTIRMHNGDVLLVQPLPDGGLVTAGDDGSLQVYRERQLVRVASTGNKWASALAVAPDRRIAYACGRTVWLQDTGGGWTELAQPRSVESLAFDATGQLLAIGLYDAVVLQECRQAGPPRCLSWKGVPTRMIFSLDGRYLLMAMRDGGLHGWCLKAPRHFRMLGYENPVTDWSWSPDGIWLATNGSRGAVLWPLTRPEGPIGAPPLELGDRPQHYVTAVACHPTNEWVAVGYSDGAIVLESMEGDHRRIVGQAGRDSLTALAWHPDGIRLAYGSQSGDCGSVLTH